MKLKKLDSKENSIEEAKNILDKKKKKKEEAKNISF